PRLPSTAAPSEGPRRHRGQGFAWTLGGVLQGHGPSPSRRHKALPHTRGTSAEKRCSYCLPWVPAQPERRYLSCRSAAAAGAWPCCTAQGGVRLGLRCDVAERRVQDPVRLWVSLCER